VGRGIGRSRYAEDEQHRRGNEQSLFDSKHGVCLESLKSLKSFRV
jgi:hypothetical protein